MTVNLGPITPTLAEPEVKAMSNIGAYNPRCLKRDVSEWVSSRFNTDQNSTDLITQNTDIYWFQTVMQGTFNLGEFGVHTGGHFTIGGDPGGDLFTSPGDPAFWLHHGQIDRTWWIWQNQDLRNRLYAISGTITINNNPPSRNGTLDDLLSLGVNAEDITIRDAMSTMRGPFCYIYL
jgi:tyrosinase